MFRSLRNFELSAETMSTTQPDGFRHEALFYDGLEQFVPRCASFIRSGLAAAEPVLVIVGSAKIAALREELNGDAGAVGFADMGEVGRNPSRIIPLWSEFIAEPLADQRRVRAIGEPIWAGRSEEELIESQRHESLLNLVFADSPGLWLLCPYDVGSLDYRVIEEARRSHPFIIDGEGSIHSPSYRGLEESAAPFDVPLPEPATSTTCQEFGDESLRELRAYVRGRAIGAGLDDDRSADLELAFAEVATNSLQYGGGRGTLRVWQEDQILVCEVSDAGHIEDPLAGRHHPSPDDESGRGLWMANQLCELVQLRSFTTGTVVRLHVRCP